MTEFLLIRHAENDWVSTGRLAGWTPGVHLNPHGRLQAQALGERLAAVRLTAIYTSPLERAVETAKAVAALSPSLVVQPLEDVGEVRFGQWEGKLLGRLRREPLWNAVQSCPSRVAFPGGETFRQAQARAVDAIERLAARHPRQRVAVVSHSDVIKLVLAHFLGLHLDLFQRIEVAPASLSVIHLAADRPTIRCINDTSHLPPRPPQPPSSAVLRRVGRLVRLRR
ncbi:MAG: MSMEG_4193 family putative phosphomutase [Chloroflexota bacterium]